MTYRSRGRSIFEVVLAVVFVGFLVGFITVLCIGNYFRAKRAQERQRQRRHAKLASGNTNSSSTRGSASMAQSAYAGSVAGTAFSEAPFDGSSVDPSQLGGYEAPLPLPTSPGVPA